MIKLIKLCFVCCLIFRATFVEAVITKEEAYEAIKELEANFWLKELIPYDDLCSEKECITKSVTKYLEPLCERETFKIVNAKTKKEKSQPLNFKRLDKNLDFSETNLGNVIFNFYRILQCKVGSRDEEYKTSARGDIWNIKYDNEGYAFDGNDVIIDPYFSEITNIGEKAYHLHLDYDGGDKIKYQTGNCYLRTTDEKALSWAGDCSKLNDNEHYVLQNFLFCLEVSRRKVVDPNRDDFEDVFCALPILGAIVTGLELMNDQIINKADFFVTGRKYCCFSDSVKKGKFENSKNYNNRRIEERTTHIKNLLQKFFQYKNFKTKEQFLEEMRKLYERFINLKVTDRVLYLDERHPSVIQKYPYCKLMENINRDLVEKRYHIVDNNDRNHSLQSAVQQSMKQQNYRKQSDKNIQFKTGAKLKDKVNFLEKKFAQKVIILDAIGVFVNPDNPAIFLDSGELWQDSFKNVLENYAEDKKIVLLRRGSNRWQAVLPD